jgi:hypothetical protein
MKTAPLRHLAAVVAVAAGVAHLGVAAASWQDYAAQIRTPSSCPDYTNYAQQPHKPYSTGPLRLPFMRPSEECRTFKSPAVEVRQSPPRQDWRTGVQSLSADACVESDSRCQGAHQEPRPGPPL